MAEVEGSTGSTQEKNVEAAKKRIAAGNGTKEDFKLVSSTLIQNAKSSASFQNLPAVGGWQKPAEKQPDHTKDDVFNFNPIDAYYHTTTPILRGDTEGEQKRKDALDKLLSQTKGDLATWASANPDKFLEMKNRFNQEAAREMAGNPQGSARDSSNQAFYRKNELLNDVANTLRIGEPKQNVVTQPNVVTPPPSRPVTTVTLPKETIPGVPVIPSGAPETTSEDESPRARQVSETVSAMKSMDPLTFWDILEGGLKGWSGNFDTARKQKVADYKEAQKQFDRDIEERKKTEEERAFQKSQLDAQLKQERELAERQFAFQGEESAEDRAAKLEQMGYDRQTAIILANITKPQPRTSTPAEIATAAIGGPR